MVRIKNCPSCINGYILDNNHSDFEKLDAKIDNYMDFHGYLYGEALMQVVGGS